MSILSSNKLSIKLIVSCDYLQTMIYVASILGFQSMVVWTVETSRLERLLNSNVFPAMWCWETQCKNACISYNGVVVVLLNASVRNALKHFGFAFFFFFNTIPKYPNFKCHLWFQFSWSILCFKFVFILQRSLTSFGYRRTFRETSARKRWSPRGCPRTVTRSFRIIGNKHFHKPLSRHRFSWRCWRWYSRTFDCVCRR